MASPSQAVQAKLLELQGLLDTLYKAEKVRLLAERAFLEQVLSKSYGGASAPTQNAQVTKVLADLAKVVPIS
jgi:hypothetical protein